jgi:hypothetical protein
MSLKRALLFVMIAACVPWLAGWTTASGTPYPDDGLSCNGNLIEVGNPIDRVYEKCGQPLGGSQQCDAWGHHCSGSWLYRPRAGDLPRYVIFTDDIVRSIQAGSRFAR